MNPFTDINDFTGLLEEIRNHYKKLSV